MLADALMPLYNFCFNSFLGRAIFSHVLQERFTGKHLCWSLFLIKFIEKSLQHKCFPPCEYGKIFKSIYLVLHLWTAIWMFSYRSNTVVASHIGSESDVFSKANWKIYSKTQINEKELPFHVLDNFVFLVLHCTSGNVCPT